MDQQGRFRRAALALGVPEDETDRFVAWLRLSIRLSGGSDGVPVGRFGGAPRLPVGEERPAAGGGPLPFVFSVDCAALPRVDGFDLPADGSLLFFLDHEKDHLAGADGEPGHGRLVFVPADAVVVNEPADPEGYVVRATLHAELPEWLDPGDGDEDDEDDLSPFQQGLADAVERELPHLAELRALAYELWPPGEGLVGAVLGGYVDDEIMQSIAEQTLTGREKAGEIVVPVSSWYSQVEQEKHRLTDQWLTLARFPPADEFYHASFVIRHDDLAAGRLDRALSVTEFSE